ncbi:ABC transporter ATP-binding protein [Rubritalea tangerina]
MLSIQSITKQYPSTSNPVLALNDVSFSAEPGEMLVITGRSGSGKSTLLNILAGLLTPSSGDYSLDGTAPFSLSKSARNAWRASHLGILYPDFRLLPYLNVAENIITPSLELQLPNTEIKHRCAELMQDFDITSRHDHLPAALSSGEQQRTALARALFAHPKLIVADEPTGNLDETNSNHIIETLKNYANAGNYVILATHDPIAIDHADRTLHLDNGKLI